MEIKQRLFLLFELARYAHKVVAIYVALVAFEVWSWLYAIDLPTTTANGLAVMRLTYIGIDMIGASFLYMELCDFRALRAAESEPVQQLSVPPKRDPSPATARREIAGDDVVSPRFQSLFKGQD